MEFDVVRIDPAKERRMLVEMWGPIFPHEQFFEDEVWLHPEVEAYWIVIKGEKVGFTVFQLNVTVAGTYEQDMPRDPGTMYILIVGLKPGFRGMGLGTRVKQWHIDYARRRGDVRRLVSNHRVSNTASYMFNVKAGYEVAGTKPDYYPDPKEDSTVMQYRI
jgi:RimJ/RimL family protein N-acetyltransferase